MAMTKTHPDSQLHQLVSAFSHVLKGLSALTRFGKTLDPEDVVFAVGLLPRSVQQELTSRHLFWAAQQLMLDPDPVQDLALPIALLRYLYPTEGRTPRFDRGMRPDLEQRMRSDRFVSIAPPRHEHTPAREAIKASQTKSPHALLSGAPVLPRLRTRSERIAHLEHLARLTGVENPRQPCVELSPEPSTEPPLEVSA